MPELRRDPVIGRWVIISTDRAKRPNDFNIVHVEEPEIECPFCEGHELSTPPEIYALRKSETKKDTAGWNVRVVPSIAPKFKIEGELDRRGVGMYDVMNPIGAHEVIIESPRHLTDIHQLSESEIYDVLTSSIFRITELEKDARFKYCLLFKNHGLKAGGSRRTKHLRSQLIATPVTPTRLKEELRGSRFYYEYKERCIFCDIIRQEMENGTRVIMETKTMAAIAPFASRFPFEIWILPKIHRADFMHIQDDEIKELASVLKTLFAKLSRSLNDPPYNYMLHTAPFRRSKRPGYWHTIEDDFHWHIEIMPRITQVAGFEWGSGFYINPTPPEDAAKYLREMVIGEIREDKGE